MATFVNLSIKSGLDLMDQLLTEMTTIENPPESVKKESVNQLRIDDNVIEGVYITDMNIQYIHEYMIKYLSENRSRLQEVKMK